MIDRHIRDLRYLNRVRRELGSRCRQNGTRSLFYDRAARPMRAEAYLLAEARRGDNVVAVSKFGGLRVSTIYLGIDHNHGKWLTGHSRPLVFETKVFAGERCAEIHGLDIQWRCTYEREARILHKCACRLVARRLKQYAPETIAAIAAAEDARIDTIRRQMLEQGRELAELVRLASPNGPPNTPPNAPPKDN